MNKKYDVVAFGEILIDFTFAGVNAEGKNIYEENTGGAPANCVGALCKLGGSGAFIGMTGKDSFGEDVRKCLSDINVDIGGMGYCHSQHTTLAFVTLNQKGERSFSFCRNPGADTQMSYSDIKPEYVENARILHIGSLSLTDEPAKTTTLELIKKVKDCGGYISYDPNWRANLWHGREDAVSLLKSIFEYADIVKVSDEELELLFGKDISYENGAKKISEYGVSLVLVTLGSKGVYYSFDDKKGKCFSGVIGTPDVKVVDTTGAGDSFNGGLLFRLTRRNDIFNFTKEDLEKDLLFANCVASLCVSKRGAIPALPDKKDVDLLYDSLTV